MNVFVVAVVVLSVAKPVGSESRIVVVFRVASAPGRIG
jgi:hypothetical protein